MRRRQDARAGEPGAPPESAPRDAGAALAGLVARAGWRAWEALPESQRRAVRPALATIRRRRRRSTPLPSGAPAPLLPAEAVELDTSIGTLWLDGGDLHLTPWIRSQGVWEADVMKLLARTLRPGGVLVDVGANIGFHTLAAASLVGAEGHVYAVEPQPWALELLRANIWRHGRANVTVLPFAASSAPGTVHLALDPSHRSGARLAPETDGGLDVTAARLDDLVPDVAADVLKVDVEGAEPAVLRGAGELLRRSPRLLAVVEFRDEPHLSGERPEDVLAYYRSLGFELCLLRRNGELTAATARTVLDRARRVDSLNLALRRPA